MKTEHKELDKAFKDLMNDYERHWETGSYPIKVRRLVLSDVEEIVHKILDEKYVRRDRGFTIIEKSCDKCKANSLDLDMYCSNCSIPKAEVEKKIEEQKKELQKRCSLKVRMMRSGILTELKALLGKEKDK